MGKTKPKPPPEIFLGQWLKYYGKTQTEAAEVADCTQSYIANIKAGRKKNINYLILWRISEFLGIAMDDIFKPAPQVVDMGLSTKAKHSIRERHRRTS